jgi:hypothetical protein
LSINPLSIKTLWHIRIISDLANGDLADAQGSLDRMRSLKWFDPTDPVINDVSNARASVDKMPVFSSSGEIPKTDEADGFSFGLYRRNFGISNIVGSLDKLTLSCRE